jgi:hypothetical protein
MSHVFTINGVSELNGDLGKEYPNPNMINGDYTLMQIIEEISKLAVRLNESPDLTLINAIYILSHIAEKYFTEYGTEDSYYDLNDYQITEVFYTYNDDNADEIDFHDPNGIIKYVYPSGKYVDMTVEDIIVEDVENGIDRHSSYMIKKDNTLEEYVEDMEKYILEIRDETNIIILSLCDTPIMERTVNIVYTY